MPQCVSPHTTTPVFRPSNRQLSFSVCKARTDGVGVEMARTLGPILYENLIFAAFLLNLFSIVGKSMASGSKNWIWQGSKILRKKFQVFF